MLKDVVKKNEGKRWDGKIDESVGVKLGIDEFEKKTWMSSVQLWSKVPFFFILFLIWAFSRTEL